MGKYFIVTAIVTIFATLQDEVVAKPPPLGIINGTDAEEGELPYMVQLRDANDNFLCGGAIIGPEWILTVAECLDYHVITIVYGTNTLHHQDHYYTNTTIKAKKSFKFPKYYHSDLGLPIHNVGIVQLAEPLPLGRNAQPVKLAEASQDVPFHVQGVLAGWGSSTIFGGLMQNLQKINLQLLTDQECTKKINGYNGDDTFVSTYNICTDDYNNGLGPVGDMGDPYVINGTQFGMISWANSLRTIPAVYSRLSNPEYREWIRNITNI